MADKEFVLIDKNTVKDIPLIKQKLCPDEIRNIIEEYGMAYQIHNKSRTEIRFHNKYIAKVTEALKKCQSVAPGLKMLSFDGGEHTGFDYPIVHTKGPYVHFRSTGKEVGGKSANDIARDIGINPDDAREIGVGLCLCLILNNVKPDAFVEGKYNKSIFKNLKIAANLDDVIKFCLLVPDKFEIAYTCAKTLKDNFDKFNHSGVSIDKFEIHHKTNVFNEVKRLGKQHSGLNEDKWNPADLFLVQFGCSNTVLKKIKEFKSYLEYNNYISSNTDIIGVSLKESREGALHGSVSGQVFCGHLIGQSSQTRIAQVQCDKYNEKLIKFVPDFFKKLKKIAGKVPVYTLVKDIDNPEQQLISVMKKCGQGIKVKTTGNTEVSKAFFKSISGCLAVYSELIDHSKYKTEKLNEIFKIAFDYAESKLSNSCPYEKILGSEYEHVGYMNTPAEIQGIYIPCDGQTQFVCNVKIDGHVYKFQLRSKTASAPPQFIVISNGFDPKGFKRFK